MNPTPSDLSPDLMWGFLPKPVAVALAIVMAVAYVVSEVTGKLNGPLSRLLERRKDRQDRQAVGWRERDRRVDELEKALQIQERTLERLEEQIRGQDDELRMVHRLSDHQRRAIRAHTDWDNEWVPRARILGLDIPDPPDLYVYLEDEVPRL